MARSSSLRELSTARTGRSGLDLYQVERGDLAPERARSVVVEDALVDTGATTLALPSRIIRGLGLRQVAEKHARSTRGTVGVFEAVRLTIQDRFCTVDVMEVPDEVPVLIGEMPLEMLDLVVDPQGRRLIESPAHQGEHVRELSESTFAHSPSPPLVVCALLPDHPKSVDTSKEHRAVLIGRRTGMLVLSVILVEAVCLAEEPPLRPAEITFPGESWEQRRPEQVGLDGNVLDQLAAQLRGRGCVVRQGYVVKTWGDQAQVADWASSAKPVLSTLLFFAVEERLVKSVDQTIVDFGWKLSDKDRAITFRQLGAMTSGYARPEAPGAAWAYNDFAIQLYQRTLFDKVFQADAKAVAEHPARLGKLQFEEGLRFTDRRRLSTSVRDFARIAWFWLNRGHWNGQQLLPRRYFDEYMQPQVPKDLPATQRADTVDYLEIQSYGGGSDHFTAYGPGIYGFNWWFNATGRSHPDALTWPDAPADTVMSIGARGNNTAIIPSLGLVLVCASGDWSDLKAGDPGSKINQALKLLSASIDDRE